MKYSLISLCALFLLANTASAASTDQVRGIIKKPHQKHHRALKVKKSKSPKSSKAPSAQPSLDAAAGDAAVTTEEDPTIAGTGQGEAGDFEVTKGTDSDKELNELSGERDTSSGNKFYSQESSIAVGAILTAGLGFL